MEVRIEYLAKTGEATLRTIRPMEIVGDPPVALRAMCLLRNAERTFILQRILHIWRDAPQDNPDDLISDFMRIDQTGGRTVLEVAVVEWVGSHEPSLKWKTFRTWVKPPSQEQIERAQQKALQIPRFFQRCAKCSELCNRGHMWEKGICQGCAERYFHVCF